MKISGSAASTPLEVRFAHAQLSRNRRALIRAILENHDQAYFLSSRELAKRYKVDAATVVRAIQDLGYERFADFAADLREHFVRQITPYTVLRASTRKRKSVADHVDDGLERDTGNLRVLESSLQAKRVVELATLMHRSRRILVVGVDLAASLAWFLAYGLTPLGFAAEAPVGSAGNLHHRIDALTGEDLVIAHQLRALPQGDGGVGPQSSRSRCPDLRHHRRQHHPAGDVHRWPPGGTDHQPFVHGLIRRADGPDQRDHSRVRAPSAEARARLAAPHRDGIPIGRALVSGTAAFSERIAAEAKVEEFWDYRSRCASQSVIIATTSVCIITGGGSFA